jgi:hypothetical protein
MTNQPTQLLLHLDTELEPDEEELETLTHQLREELEELDYLQVDFVRQGDIPEKAKVAEPITLGTLLLSLAASGGVLTALISAIQGWLTRNGQRSVTLEMGGDKLVVTGISSEEQRRLIDDWLTRNRNVGG